MNLDQPFSKSQTINYALGLSSIKLFRVLWHHCNQGCGVVKSRRFLVESDSWQHHESESDFFVRLWMSNWIICYITLLNWHFLLKWYNFFWNFCWNRVLAVHQNFHLL